VHRVDIQSDFRELFIIHYNIHTARASSQQDTKVRIADDDAVIQKYRRALLIISLKILKRKDEICIVYTHTSHLCSIMVAHWKLNGTAINNGRIVDDLKLTALFLEILFDIFPAKYEKVSFILRSVSRR
jgi:hypothetical protein